MANASCPVGGSWYSCTRQSPPFLGCCTSEACNGSGCPKDDLRAAGLGPGDSSYWPNATCDHGKWWTCAQTNPTFQGCCLSNPCLISDGSCPMGNLFPMAWGTPSSASTPPPASSWIQTPSSTPTAIISTSAPAESSTPSSSKYTSIQATTSTTVITLTTVINGQTTAAVSTITLISDPGQSTAAVVTSPSSSTTPLPSVSSSSDTNLPTIVGAGVGGGVGAIVILAAVIFFLRRYLQKQRRLVGLGAPSDSPLPGDPFLGKGHNTPQTPFNEESYYPGQRIFGVPAPEKKVERQSRELYSPAPPSYHSAHQEVSNRHTQMSEIDSSTVYELGGADGGVRSGGGGGGGEGRGLGLWVSG